MRPSDKRPPRSLVWAMVVQYAAGGALYPFVTLLLRDRGFAVAEISLVLLSGSAALLANGAVAWLAPGAQPDLSGVFLFAAGLAGGATLLISARGRKLVP